MKLAPVQQDTPHSATLGLDALQPAEDSVAGFAVCERGSEEKCRLGQRGPTGEQSKLVRWYLIMTLVVLQCCFYQQSAS